MKQSELTTITRSITGRVESIVSARIPSAEEKIDGNTEITKALVHGKNVKLRSPADIKRTALNKIASGGYSSDRSFRFEEIFETSSELAAARAAAQEIERKREKLRFKLIALKDRVVADCKLGKFDVEQGAALDTFEAKAAELAA